MIDTLYDNFKYWSNLGSVYIISDTHFDDEDCKYMDPDWVTPEEHINTIKKYVHKTDTLVHLGDVGNPEYLEQVKAYKVLIMGNHDQSKSKFKYYFDEIYEGPLFIAEKILLSHEPIYGGGLWLNIHGHEHNKDYTTFNSINLASNVVNYQIFNLGKEIKKGILKDVNGIHRTIIDRATERKKLCEMKQKLQLQI